MGILKLFMLPFVVNLFISNCSPGWSVGDVQVTPVDSAFNTVFIEIMDADSVTHWYHGKINQSVNFCYLHDDFENITIK